MGLQGGCRAIRVLLAICIAIRASRWNRAVRDTLVTVFTVKPNSKETFIVEYT